MSETQLTVLCIIVSVVGALVVSGIVYFVRIKIRNGFLAPRFWEVLVDHYLVEPRRRSDMPRYVIEGYSDYLQRRNEFWTTYGQVLIAVFIVIVLAILLLTKVISAEAGLPILAGISGFAIAKGVSGARSITALHEGQEDRDQR